MDDRNKYNSIANDGNEPISAVGLVWVNVDYELPPKKENWNHSAQVLLYYENTGDKVSGLGVGYYHYDPPFSNPMFVDFHHYGRKPSFWAEIPNLPV